MNSTLLEDVGEDVKNGNAANPSESETSGYESGSAGEIEQRLEELGLESVAAQAGLPATALEYDESAGPLFDVSSEEAAPAGTIGEAADYPDAYFASFEAAPPAREDAHEVVIGADDRIQITGTAAHPWRMNCSLLIESKTGKFYVGTGWFISPRTVMTAGHCVYLHNEGGWAKSVRVMPGRNGSNLPYGSTVGTHLRSVTGWTQSKSPNNDYGCIILPEDKKIGAQTGWYGFANLGDSTLKAKYLNLSGYPADKPAGTQWYHSRKVKSVTGNRIFYEIDTAGGQSGSAVYYIQDGKRYAVGIHAYGAASGNSATRITKGVFNIMKSWKTMGS